MTTTTITVTGPRTGDFAVTIMEDGQHGIRDDAGASTSSRHGSGMGRAGIAWLARRTRSERKRNHDHQRRRWRTGPGNATGGGTTESSTPSDRNRDGTDHRSDG